MKTSTSLAVAISTACLALQSARGTLLFSEGFNYTSGTDLGGNINPGNSVAWTGGSTTLAIGSTALSYPGYQGLTGNDLVYTPNGTSSSTTINTYLAQSSGAIYYSFLINCTQLPTANTYVTSLNPTNGSPNGSSDAMAIYVNASGGSNWKIGVRTPGASATFISTALSLDTTYLVVGELTLGSSPDVVSLYLDPTPGGIQPLTPGATATGTNGIFSVDNVGFKAQTATTVGDYEIGDLLVGNTWADVTPGAVPEPSIFALGGLGALALARFRRQRR